MSRYAGRYDCSRWARRQASYGAVAVFLCIVFIAGKGWCGSLAIRSDPPGAYIFVNGTNIGRMTPAAIRIRDLPIGRTVFAVEKAGYVSVPPSQEITVELSHGNIRFSWWPPVLIKNLAGNRWRGITSPRSRCLEVFRLVAAEELVSPASQMVGHQPRELDTAKMRLAAPESDPKNAVQKEDPPAMSREVTSSISCSAKIEDDPALGNTILGNGDGRVQKGEAFDLVVVVANTSTSTVKSVSCTVALPGNTSLKTFSELHQTIESLALGASVTFRYNMTLPLNAEKAKAPQCAIEVKSGDSPPEYFDFMLPIDLL